MSKIMLEQRNNVFGALKLIEQLYLDGQIPRHVFLNIINDYGEDIPITEFNSCKALSPPLEGGTTLCMEQ